MLTIGLQLAWIHTPSAVDHCTCVPPSCFPPLVSLQTPSKMGAAPVSPNATGATPHQHLLHQERRRAEAALELLTYALANQSDTHHQQHHHSTTSVGPNQTNTNTPSRAAASLAAAALAAATERVAVGGAMYSSAQLMATTSPPTSHAATPHPSSPTTRHTHLMRQSPLVGQSPLGGSLLSGLEVQLPAPAWPSSLAPSAAYYPRSPTQQQQAVPGEGRGDRPEQHQHQQMQQQQQQAMQQQQPLPPQQQQPAPGTEGGGEPGGVRQGPRVVNRALTNLLDEVAQDLTGGKQGTSAGGTFATADARHQPSTQGADYGPVGNPAAPVLNGAQMPALLFSTYSPASIKAAGGAARPGAAGAAQPVFPQQRPPSSQLPTHPYGPGPQGMTPGQIGRGSDESDFIVRQMPSLGSSRDTGITPVYTPAGAATGPSRLVDASYPAPTQHVMGAVGVLPSATSPFPTGMVRQPPGVLPPSLARYAPPSLAKAAGLQMQGAGAQPDSARPGMPPTGVNRPAAGPVWGVGGTLGSESVPPGSARSYEVYHSVAGGAGGAHAYQGVGLLGARERAVSPGPAAKRARHAPDPDLSGLTGAAAQLMAAATREFRAGMESNAGVQPRGHSSQPLRYPPPDTWGGAEGFVGAALQGTTGANPAGMRAAVIGGMGGGAPASTAGFRQLPQSCGAAGDVLCKEGGGLGVWSQYAPPSVLGNVTNLVDAGTGGRGLGASAGTGAQGMRGMG